MNETSLKKLLAIFYQVVEQIDETLDSEVGTGAIMKWQYDCMKKHMDALGIEYTG